MQTRLSFKAYRALVESHDFSNLTPYHQYKTEDGHDVHVHVFRDGDHKTAIFHNNTLGAITKIVAFPHISNLSKEELVHAGKEVKHDDIMEAAAPSIDADTAGKVAEVALAKELINHKHKQSGTYGAAEHKKELKPYNDEMAQLSNGKDADQVAIREAHGKAMASGVIKHIDEHHPGAKVTSVGRTAKPGDIARFTQGAHTDGQENPSDVTLKLNHPDGSESYLGVSAKSTGKSSGNITAKNPGVAGQDEFLSGGPATRKSRANEIAQEGRAAILKKYKLEGLPDKSTKGDSRKARVTSVNPETGKPEINELGKKMNVEFKKNNEETARELQIQLGHLASLGPKGHAHIGKWLHSNLVSSEGMPWIKATGHGKEMNKVHAVVKPGSDSPLNAVLTDKKTRYAVHRSTSAVTVHKEEKDGTHIPIVRIGAKPKSHGAYSSQVYNFTPSSNF